MHLPVAVIGAGPCGLTACKTLAEYGLDYECLEAGDSIGGLWNVERRQSGGYRSLHTNTSSAGMSFADFPFDEGAPPYASAKQLLNYFNLCAERHRLNDAIRLNCLVANARPLADGGWELEFEGGASKQYSALVVASGQYAKPRLPHGSIAGSFSGEHLHVFDYLDAATPVDIRGKRVLVVGLGNSASELAAELCNPSAPAGCASRVILSARSGRWVLPRMVDGKPLDSRASHPAARPSAIIRALPDEFGQWLARRLLRKIFRSLTARLGSPESLGLPPPLLEPWEDRPTISTKFIPALEDGLIDVRPGIERFDGTRVHFSDGTRTEADVILYATGYQLDFPFLDRGVLGCDAPDLALYQRISHPVHDQLFFVGCCRVLCSVWPIAEQQSRWVASLLNGKFKLPSSAARARGAIPLARSLPVMCNFYVEALRKEARGC